MNSTALAILLALFGLLLLAFACRRLLQARYWAASAHIVAGFFLLASGGLLFVLALNLNTYARLDAAAPVAELSFKKTAPQNYRATLMRLPGGDLQVFTLGGDEWRLDARILKWRGWPNLLGFNAQFRLEQLSSRYQDDHQQRGGAPSAYTLSHNPGFDLWQWTFERTPPPSTVAAIYGSAPYVPMTDGARYRVTITETGLVAQPIGQSPAAKE